MHLHGKLICKVALCSNVKVSMLNPVILYTESSAVNTHYTFNGSW